MLITCFELAISLITDKFLFLAPICFLGRERKKDEKGSNLPLLRSLVFGSPRKRRGRERKKYELALTWIGVGIKVGFLLKSLLPKFAVKRAGARRSKLENQFPNPPSFSLFSSFLFPSSFLPSNTQFTERGRTLSSFSLSSKIPKRPLKQRLTSYQTA